MSVKIFLDTETTGLDAEKGHRIIEIVAIAYENRQAISQDGIFHEFCNPQREIDVDAQKVHGLDAAFLADKPLFGDIAARLQDFLRDREIFIHNAAFDVAFLNKEFERCQLPKTEKIATNIVCTLEMSRLKNAIRRHRLEDLCRHFNIDDSARTTHSALLDARLLAQVYFAMAREQMSIDITYGKKNITNVTAAAIISQLANADEIAAHQAYLEDMEAQTKIKPLWHRQ